MAADRLVAAAADHPSPDRPAGAAAADRPPRHHPAAMAADLPEPAQSAERNPHPPIALAADHPTTRQLPAAATTSNCPDKACPTVPDQQDQCPSAGTAASHHTDRPIAAAAAVDRPERRIQRAATSDRLRSSGAGRELPTADRLGPGLSVGRIPGMAGHRCEDPAAAVDRKGSGPGPGRWAAGYPGVAAVAAVGNSRLFTGSVRAPHRAGGADYA